jgi:peptidoglycan hydrolase-like protein with peptidoglycan-binding domain
LKSQPLAGFATGKGFYDPMKFTASVIAFEAAEAAAPLATAEDAPVDVMPAHSVAPETPPKPVVASFKAIRVGSKGADVKTVQKAVGAVADGIFGPKSETAVKVWQKKVGLPVTGIIDSVAWLKIVGK